MKIWKLVSGILSIVFSALVLFQSGIAGLSNALEDNGEISGSAGLLVAILMLVIGIVSIVVRKSNSKGGNIALIILSGLAAITGFTLAGNYSDLQVWSGWCVIILIMALISLFKKGGSKNEEA